MPGFINPPYPGSFKKRVYRKPNGEHQKYLKRNLIKTNFVYLKIEFMAQLNLSLRKYNYFLAVLVIATLKNPSKLNLS